MAWNHWFIFLRVIMGLAAIACSAFAIGYLSKVMDVYADINEKATIKQIDYHPFIYFSEVMVGIMYLPLVMFLRFLWLNSCASGLSRNKVRCWGFVLRMITMLMLCYTMLMSITAVALEFGKEYVLMMLALVLGSIVLLEGALLIEEIFGVFELALTVVVVQCINTYSIKKIYWYGLILLAYCLREGLMFFMRYVDQKLNKGKAGKVQELIDAWISTDRRLRNDHNIDVDRNLPMFMVMKQKLEEMRREEKNQQIHKKEELE